MSSVRRLRVRRLMPLLAVSLLLPLLSGVIPAQGVADVVGPGFQGEGSALQDDLDLRVGSVAPTARQRQLVAAMGAKAVWNRFGTPHSLSPVAGGFLATGLAADELAAARAWIRDNRSLFRLSTIGVRNLDVIRNAPIGSGRAITFQQSFGALPAGIDGRITLGLVDGKLAYVSSSIAPHAAISDRTTVSAQRAMQLAGSRAGKSVSAADISGFHRLGRLDADDDPRVHGAADGLARRRADAPTGCPAGVAHPADRYTDAIGGGDVRGRAHGRDARAGEPGRLRGRQPHLGRVPGQPADRLLLDGHAGDVVLVGRPVLRPGGGEPLVAEALGRASRRARA